MKEVIHIHMRRSKDGMYFTLSCPEYDITTRARHITDAYIELLPHLYRAIRKDEMRLEMEERELEKIGGTD